VYERTGAGAWDGPETKASQGAARVVPVAEQLAFAF